MISSVYKLTLSLFHCGHVQKIQVCNEITSNNIFIQANCLPEMREISTRLSCSWRNHPLISWQLSVTIQLAEALVQADPSCNLVGIAKFKYPCAKLDNHCMMHVLMLTFKCGELLDGQFQLKHRHYY